MSENTSLRELVAKWRTEADAFMAYTTAPAGRTWDHGAADAKREDARQLEAALSTPPAEGVVLVPRIASEVMHKAAWDACDNGGKKPADWAAFNQTLWSAMIAATEGSPK